MYWVVVVRVLPLFFFFHDMQATEIYTLSLHDALPISKKAKELGLKPIARIKAFASAGVDPKYMGMRSEEHTSELQSPMYLVCRLLLEKKKEINPHLTTNQQTTHIQRPAKSTTRHKTYK